MCGIAGIFDPQMNEAELDHQVATMAEVLRHRGPADGYFKPETIQQLWQQFLTDRPANEASLWGVLMFQQWLDRFRTMEES